MNTYIKIIILSFCFLAINSALSAQCFDNGHSTFKNQGWLSCTTSVGPIPERGDQHWVLYDLGEPYPIDTIEYWNHNVWGETGQGAKEILIDYSTDQTNWTTIGPITLEKAPGSWKYTGAKGPSLQNATMQYMLITVISTWDDINACAGIAELKFNIGEFVDTEEIELASEWTLGPNPASDRINLFIPNYKEVKTITIYNSVGQKIKDVPTPVGEQIIIPISEMREGLYFMSVNSKKGMSSRSFVKE